MHNGRHLVNRQYFELSIEFLAWSISVGSTSEQTLRTFLAVPCHVLASIVIIYARLYVKKLLQYFCSLWEQMTGHVNCFLDLIPH